MNVVESQSRIGCSALNFWIRDFPGFRWETSGGIDLDDSFQPEFRRSRAVTEAKMAPSPFRDENGGADVARSHCAAGAPYVLDDGVVGHGLA